VFQGFNASRPLVRLWTWFIAHAEWTLTSSQISRQCARGWEIKVCSFLIPVFSIILEGSNVQFRGSYHPMEMAGMSIGD
jgi:hypothetical protein